MADTHKFTVTLNQEIKNQIEELKKEKYYDLTYSEIYRMAISAGIKSIKEKEKE